MSRKNNTTSRTFPIVLKSIINDAMNDKTIVDDNAKKIRAKIRANENAITKTSHVKNTSHVAHNQTQYDALRCAFDNVYAQRLIDAKKRNTTSRKRNTTSNDVVETNDA